MNVILLICCLLKSYRFYQILQLEHYQIKKYLNYVTNNYIYYNLVPLVCFFFIYFVNNDIIDFVSITALFVFMLMATTVSVVKLKFTNKIKRIYLLLFICLLILSINFKLLYFFLFELIILIPYLLNKPIDYFINKKYILKSSTTYQNFDKFKIGITGSYGKTSTKNILNDLLKNYYLGSCSYKSYNTLLGISTYINDIPLAAYDYVILEYGASKLNDINNITKYFNPDIACITEIGYMHLDTFKSIENIVKEKMSITNNAKIAILNYEQDLIRDYDINIDKITYGFNYGDFQARNIDISYKNSSFDLYYKDDFIDRINTNLIGRHQVLNLLCSICVFFYLNIDIKDVIKYIPTLTNTESRLVLKEYKKYQILDDSYNSNLVGSINALEILDSFKTKKMLVTPGFVENKKVEEDLYLKYSEKIIEVNCFVVLVGDVQTRILQNLLKDKVSFIIVEDFKSALNYINKLDDYYTILIENDLPDNYKRVI